MQLIHAEIVPELLRDLLLDFHDLCSYQTVFPQSTVFQRTCKVPEIDVRLVLKLALIYTLHEATDDSMAGAGTEMFSITAKWSLTTDCINLRYNRGFFGDSEHILLNTEIPRDLPAEDLTRVYSVFADMMIQRLDEFKLCVECRNMYMDKRHRDICQMYCTLCMFDRMFYTEDLICVICKDTVHKEEQSYTLSCAHSYHSSCILTNFIKTKRRECPLCRELDNSTN
jgi:hypothetical protein